MHACDHAFGPLPLPCFFRHPYPFLVRDGSHAERQDQVELPLSMYAPDCIGSKRIRLGSKSDSILFGLEPALLLVSHACAAATFDNERWAHEPCGSDVVIVAMTYVFLEGRLTCTYVPTLPRLEQDRIHVPSPASRKYAEGASERRISHAGVVRCMCKRGDRRRLLADVAAYPVWRCCGGRRAAGGGRRGVDGRRTDEKRERSGVLSTS
ncbi:hypothetical protein JOL62DRAFT_133700 [Phyllosticta paracitricarpa]|uniref:Uncharacterized protein n=1 Tax=Phyllosticta paracitricarpa TaxID=2016321 RepID=A0ABR1NID6_9PEZI